jgi:hypothetical protein
MFYRFNYANFRYRKKKTFGSQEVMAYSTKTGNLIIRCTRFSRVRLALLFQFSDAISIYYSPTIHENSQNPYLLQDTPPPFYPKICTHAWASLICGLGVFLLGPLAGIPAVITGRIARKKIAESRGNLSGQGMVRTGLFLGYLSIVLTLLALLLHLVLLLVGAAWVYDIYQTPEKKVDFAPPVGIESGAR